MPVSTNAHHTQLPATPLRRTMSVTRFGVSALKVVATIDRPASHHGTARPEAKNSDVLRPARLPKNSAGPKQISERRKDDDPVERRESHGYGRSLCDLGQNGGNGEHGANGRTENREPTNAILVYDAEASMATTVLPRPPDDRMRRSYIRVIVVWVITLAALYAFQEYFS